MGIPPPCPRMYTMLGGGRFLLRSRRGGAGEDGAARRRRRKRKKKKVLSFPPFSSRDGIDPTKLPAAIVQGRFLSVPHVVAPRKPMDQVCSFAQI